MKTRMAVGIYLGLFVSLLALGSPRLRYEVATRIPGPPTVSWDYAVIDPRARKVFLASDGILVLDLASQTVTRLPSSSKNMHGLAALDDGVLAVADGAHNQVQFLNSSTGRLLLSIPTGAPPSVDDWHNPDALVVEPVSGLLIAVNRDSGALVLIDIKTRTLVDIVKIGGALEFATALGDGRVAINIESRNAVAVVDIPKRRIIKRISMQNCDSPTGLAYDQQDHLVLSVCSNGVAKFIDPDQGAELASRPVGKGADAILYDGVRRKAFITAGDDGTLTVIAINGRQDIRVTQTIDTQQGVRLGAIDTDTGALYLPAVRYSKTLPPVILPGLPPMPAPIPETFQFLVVKGM